MKASELVVKLNNMIEEYGDKDIRVVGCFNGGTHDFIVSDESEYYKSMVLDFGHGISLRFEDAPNNCFLIDEV